jgi:hypothetical protein
MRVTERYEAVVADNQDEEVRGRIKVTCVGLLGDDETVHPMWIEPVLDWGWFYVPDIGEIVEIEVVTSSDEDQFPGEASISGEMRWRGKRFFGNEEADNDDDKRPVNPVFTEENYGKRRGFATPKGHVLVFDDTDGAEMIRLSWTNDQGETLTFIEIDKDGKLYISNKEEQLVQMTDDEILVSHKDAQKVTIKDDNIEVDNGGAQKITMDGSTVVVDHGLGNKMTLGDDSCKVELGGESFILSGNTATVLAKVGGSAAIDAACKEIPMNTLWGVLQGVLQAHIHPSAAGPTAVSPAPFPPWVAAIKSEHLKIP